VLSAIDFSACPRVPGRAYNGANGKKIAVSFEGATWLLKFPPNAAEIPNGLSYSNSCFSEHIGCTVFGSLGIDVQETRLGTFRNGREHVVCACRDFTVPGLRLIDFCSVKNTVLDTGSGGTGTELGDVLETIDGQQFMDPVAVRRRFWEMFVVDALLGNFDRHNGNWGFLVNDRTGAIGLAPVFDCGSCLLPQADERIMRAMLEDAEELNARVYTFPNSMLKVDGRKINYVRFVRESEDEGFREAYGRLSPRIAQLDFASVLAAVPYLGDLPRQFYRTYLEARRDVLLGASRTEKPVSSAVNAPAVTGCRGSLHDAREVAVLHAVKRKDRER